MADEIDWSLTTHAGNRRRQHAEFRALSFREKLLRIEQMEAVAEHFSARRAAAGRLRRRNEPPGMAGQTAGVRAALRELRERFETLYGSRLARLVLYGSYARGEAHRGSDVDVLVVLHGPVDPAREIARVGPITAGISLDADVVLSCQFVSEERFASEQSPLLMNVRREGVAV